MRKAIAIDFDGCLFTDAFPAIGEPNWEVINAAIEEQCNGVGLILWTCREGRLLQDAVDACEGCGLAFDAVNESLPDWIEEFGTGPRKVGASEYWDDKAVIKGRWPPEVDAEHKKSAQEIDGKKILDATCGARTIWFNKHHPAAIYCDRRNESHQHLWKNAENCHLDINPDIQCDFTAMPFPDGSFPLVIFDPPHLTGAKETSWLVKKYGKLDESWPQMIRDGFRECMRVLKPDGVLIFKWSEHDIPAEKVWRAIGEKPLFGHHSGRKSKTFWACFMKLEVTK